LEVCATTRSSGSRVGVAQRVTGRRQLVREQRHRPDRQGPLGDDAPKTLTPDADDVVHRDVRDGRILKWPMGAEAGESAIEAGGTRGWVPGQISSAAHGAIPTAERGDAQRAKSGARMT
jgi:hypothetical protein